MKNTFKLNTNSIFETNATIRSFVEKVTESFPFNIERNEITYSDGTLKVSVYINKMPLRIISLVVTNDTIAEIRLTKSYTTDYSILNRDYDVYANSDNWFLAQTISSIASWRDENLVKVKD